MGKGGDRHTGNRPPLLTDDVERILLREAAAGVFQSDAAVLAGVKQATLKDWLYAGRAQEGTWLAGFANRYDAALAKFTAKASKRFARSRESRDLQWLLERLDPKRYHLPLRVIVDGDRRAVLVAVGQVAEELLDAELRSKFLARLAQALLAGESGGGDVGPAGSPQALG
jgi:hypothetical protein